MIVKAGDRVKKSKGFKFIGTVLTIYTNTSGHWYAVVELDKNEASDELQHIYKIDQLELL